MAFKTLIINQEADEIAYRVAFSCQPTGYIVDTGKSKKKFSTRMKKKTIIDGLKDRGRILNEDYTLESYKVILEDYIAKARLDMQMQALHNISHPEIGKVLRVQPWLSPSDGSNFRYNVANIPGPKGLGYKAGRPEKPHHLKMLRQRLIDKWDAKEVTGYEADDALSMYQTGNTIASHVDKDISMVSGGHYNWVEDEWYHVKEGLGELELSGNKLKRGGLIFFYAQLLMGDATDNIPGIPKVGPVKSYNLLKDCTEEQQAFNIASDLYKQQYGDMWQEAIAEVADLLWMVRADRLTGRQYLQERGFIE